MRKRERESVTLCLRLHVTAWMRNRNRKERDREYRIKKRKQIRSCLKSFQLDHYVCIGHFFRTLECTMFRLSRFVFFFLALIYIFFAVVSFISFILLFCVCLEVQSFQFTTPKTEDKVQKWIAVRVNLFYVSISFELSSYLISKETAPKKRTKK